MFLTQSFGLGDLAHWLFRPAAFMIDLFWGTDLKHCDRCAERRSAWNRRLSLRLWAWLVLLTCAGGVYFVLT